MLRRAAREHGVDLGQSWMVGDRPADIGAGRAAGCRTIRVGTRSGANPIRAPIRSARPRRRGGDHPDFTGLPVTLTSYSSSSSSSSSAVQKGNSRTTTRTRTFKCRGPSPHWRARRRGRSSRADMLRFPRGEIPEQLPRAQDQRMRVRLRTLLLAAELAHEQLAVGADEDVAAPSSRAACSAAMSARYSASCTSPGDEFGEFRARRGRIHRGGRRRIRRARVAARPPSCRG